MEAAPRLPLLQIQRPPHQALQGAVEEVVTLLARQVVIQEVQEAYENIWIRHVVVRIQTDATNERNCF